MVYSTHVEEHTKKTKEDKAQRHYTDTANHLPTQPRAHRLPGWSLTNLDRARVNGKSLQVAALALHRHYALQVG